MDSKKLKTWQAQKMVDRLRPTLGYLSRMVRRTELTRFPATDPLYLDAVKAQAEMQGLVVRLHYLSCSSGVGQPPRD